MRSLKLQFVTLIKCFFFLFLFKLSSDNLCCSQCQLQNTQLSYKLLIRARRWVLALSITLVYALQRRR